MSTNSSSVPTAQEEPSMRLYTSIIIQRPITEVFAYLTTPDRLPCWVAGVAGADGPLPDQQGVGATLVIERTASVGSARSTWEVTAYEPPRTLALRGLDDGAGVEVFWTLEGLPSDATRVRVEADVQAVGFFRPEPRHLAELGARPVQDSLEVLRRRLEADT
jgi:uncharacterized protein YndB with AHSA1/START domain